MAMAGLPNGNGSGATTSVAIVAARAERLSRIAALARNDLQYASDGGGDGFPAPVLEAPWMQRRLQRNSREQQQRQQDQVVALAVGMGQQFGAMQRQLEEQSRQLKDLAVGHCAQTSLQQQLLKLLDKIQDASKQVCRPRVEQEDTNLPYGSHTPEEYHTIAWLDSHRQAGKQDRIKHPLPHGFKPIRKSGTHTDNRSSASDRTRTTVGAIDRICRATSQRSTPLADTDRSVGSASKRNTEPHGVSNLSTDASKDKMFENTNKRRLPLVAALYAKCKHKTHKKNSTREKVLKSIRELPNQAEHRVALSRLEAENQSHSQGVELVEKKAMDSELDDTILDSMLSLHKYEDELKLRWLVPDAAEHGKTTGSCWHSITDEIANLEDGKTSRYGEGLNEQHLGDNWLIKEQARRNSRRNYTKEWLTDTLMDEVLKEIAGELCSLCDNFVEHIYYSEFLNQEP